MVGDELVPAGRVAFVLLLVGYAAAVALALVAPTDHWVFTNRAYVGPQWEMPMSDVLEDTPAGGASMLAFGAMMSTYAVALIAALAVLVNLRTRRLSAVIFTVGAILAAATVVATVVAWLYARDAAALAKVELGSGPAWMILCAVAVGAVQVAAAIIVRRIAAVRAAELAKVDAAIAQQQGDIV